MKKLIYLLFIFTLLVMSCAQPNEPARSLEIENYIQTSRYAIDIDVTENNIFVVEEDMGFSIYDINGNIQLSTIDSVAGNSFGNPKLIKACQEGETAFFYDISASPPSIYIYDISNVNEPIWVSSIIGNTGSIDYMNTYFEDDTGSVIYWENDNEITYGYFDEAWYPTNSYSLDGLNSNEYIDGFDFGEDFVVIASKQAGIKVFKDDLSDMISTLDLLGEAQDVSMYEDYAYVSLRQEGFAIIDLSDKTTPELIKKKEAPDYLYTVDVENKYLVFSSHSGGVLLYDISDETNPNLIGRVEKNKIGYTYKVVLKNGKIYASTRRGIYIINIK